jgi:LPS export ABC transporter protein LptC
MSRAPLAVLLAAGLLATACDNRPTPPPTGDRVKLDSADQIMFKVTTAVTDAGLLRARLTADTTYLYQDNTRADLRVVTAYFYSQMGARTATLTSKRGTYDMRVGWMEALGNVVVISEDGRKLETPQLRYDPQKNEISSDSAFVLTEPDRVLRGIGFTSDPNLSLVTVKQAASGEGARVQVPDR